MDSCSRHPLFLCRPVPKIPFHNCSKVKQFSGIETCGMKSWGSPLGLTHFFCFEFTTWEITIMVVHIDVSPPFSYWLPTWTYEFDESEAVASGSIIFSLHFAVKKWSLWVVGQVQQRENAGMWCFRLQVLCSFLIQYWYSLFSISATRSNNMEAEEQSNVLTPFSVPIATGSCRPGLPVGIAASGWGPPCNGVCRPLLAT